jgi:hypothetical protein
MTLPIAYLAPTDWYRAYLICPEQVEIEGLESFEKQTCRNRCIIGSTNAESTKYKEITLTVPVKKVEHKQYTRDMEISYQTRWQHQHWISLVSAYKHTPFFDYYAEFFKPWYEKETKFLWDLNTGLHEVICSLLANQRPATPDSTQTAALTAYRPNRYKPTSDWRNEELNRYFGDGKSVLDLLFEYGPSTIERIKTNF